MKKIIDIEKLKILIDKGIQTNTIAENLGVSSSTIKRRYKELGLKSKYYEIKNTDSFCDNCGENFKSLKSDKRKFCTKSCSAIYNNKKRIKKEKPKHKIVKFKIIGKCINCNNDILKNNGNNIRKYCSVHCQKIYEMNIRIENGNFSFRTAKLYLIYKHGEKCMQCGWCEKNPITGKIPVELEHKDGNSDNNNLDNINLLCPNCHSLTPTYRALNKGNGRYKRRQRYKEGKSF